MNRCPQKRDGTETRELAEMHAPASVFFWITALRICSPRQTIPSEHSLPGLLEGDWAEWETLREWWVAGLTHFIFIFRVADLSAGILLAQNGRRTISMLVV